MADEEEIRRRRLGGMPIPQGGVFTEESRRSILDAIHLDSDDEAEAVRAASMFFGLLQN
jgi:hypothetical protein